MKKWIIAARLKTLPLALSGPLMAAGIAILSEYSIHYGLVILTLLVALLLQILSNFANDLGDYQKGTDQKADRNDRALTAGIISERQMKWAIAYLILFTLLIGIYLIIIFNPTIMEAATLFTTGCIAIIAAIAYTMGKKAYGYLGLGDIFVFIFFGLVSVLFSYYIFTHVIDLIIIIAATIMGFLACAVLHINNMRDIDSDLKNNKKTLANAFGYKKSRQYQILILGLASIGICILMVNFNMLILSLNLILFIPIAHLFLNLERQDKAGFNQQLKWVSLQTFAIGLFTFLTALIQTQL